MRQIRFQRCLAALVMGLCSIGILGSNRVSDEAFELLRLNGDSKGKQIAILKSFLVSDPVTVGLHQDGPGIEPIRSAVDVWKASLPESPFVLAAAGAKPMVSVQFVDQVPGRDRAQGQIEIVRKLRWGPCNTYRIEATLLVRKTHEGRSLTDEEITWVVAHELGHILGLEDVDEENMLMGRFCPDKVVSGPTKAEIIALQSHRERLRQALSRLE